MASNPYFSPLHTQRFSFIGSPQQRDGTYLKDQRFVNMYPEMIKSPITDGKKYYLKKRPGLNLQYNFGQGEGRGNFYWNGFYYNVVNNILYVNNTALIILSTTSGRVGFSEFRDTGTDLLFFCDGVHGYTISTANTFVQITDPNFPTPHQPFPIFLDGYIFLAGVFSQTIFNSNLGDPTIWTSGDFIDAEMYPDNIVCLVKNQNYLVAVGTQSVEFFYDNANATGSPLQRNAPAVAQFGCPAFETVNQTEKEVIMVGSTDNGGRTVWVIEGFQPTEIANEPIREALDLEAGNIASAFAFTVQVSGHKWYVLNLFGNSRTFVYDFEEQMWHEWSAPFTQSIFPWRCAADSGLGVPVLLNYSNGQTAFLDPSIYMDIGNPITCTITTSKIDFDTIMRKRFFRLSLAADAPNGDANVPITVNWSDDDYNTWVGNKTLQINGTYPTITQLGYSRRRAFQFIYTQPYALRMEAFEVDVTQEVRR